MLGIKILVRDFLSLSELLRIKRKFVFDHSIPPTTSKTWVEAFADKDLKSCANDSDYCDASDRTIINGVKQMRDKTG